MHSHIYGPRGYFGKTLDEATNVKVDELNKIIDEYNSNLNSFDTKEETEQFINSINERLHTIIKSIE